MQQHRALSILFLLLLSIAGCTTPNTTTSTAHFAATPSSTTEPQKEVTVYVTRTGTKYHREGCRHLRRSKIPRSLSEIAGRYEPCGVCRPPR